METLKEVYQDSFLIGNIYTPKVLKNKGLQQLLKTQFNVLTAENIMKPAFIQPQRGTFTFDAADDMMDYAKANDFKVAGHTLAWHQQTLGWLDETTTTKEEALALLRAHITAIMTRYQGKIMSWDVLNEAIEDDVQADPKEWHQHLRPTPWFRLLGEDYVSHIFHMAHELDPIAKLYYNDYNLNDQSKREATYYMVKALRAAGVPIHGIGMQGHYHTHTPLETIEESLALFSQLDGIEVSITELDVTVTGSEKSETLSKAHELLQGQYYAQLFQIYKRYEKTIKRITFWGTDDATSWRSQRFPTLFNQDYSPKQAFYAIMDPDKFLRAHPPIKRDGPQIAVATYGTPKLGAIQTWSKAQPLSVSQQLTAWEGATAKAYTMWNEENLYVLVDVSVLTQTSPSKSSVAIDISLSKSDQGDHEDHITITFENKVSFNGKAKPKKFESFVTTTETGYQVQAQIPLQQALSAHQIIGFDLQVNDSNAQGIRQSVATWHRLTSTLPHRSTDLGHLKLQK